jgi:hypothetical protein
MKSGLGEIAWALLIAGLVGVQLVAARAAGPFDGSWKGSLGGSKRVCDAAVVAMISDGKLDGTVQFATGTAKLSGTVAPDGTFAGELAGTALSGKFAQTTFETRFVGPRCGSLTLDLQRS